VFNAYQEISRSYDMHGYGVSTRAIVYKGHGLRIVIVDDDKII